MITVTKQENGVLFTFENSDKYLYGSGTIEVPFNSLSIIQDESDNITLRKSASNDIFLSARYDTDFGYASKEAAVEALKEILYDEAGISEEEVQEMIDAATSGIPSSEVVEQLRRDVNAVSGEVDTKQDILTAGDNITISGNVISADAGNNIIELTQAEYDALETKDPEVLYIITDAQEINMNDYYTKSEVDASIATKADASALTAVNNALTAHTADTTVHVTQAEKNAWNGKVDTTTYESGQYATAQALNALQENKLDASAYTPTDLSEYWTSGQTQEAINAATSGIPSSQVIEQLRTDVNAVSGDVESKQDKLEYYSEAEYPTCDGGRGMINVNNGKTYGASVEADAGYTDGGTYARLNAHGEAGSNTLMVSPTGVTINGAGVLTENDINVDEIWNTIDKKEEVIASALTQLNQDVAEIDAKEEVIASALTEVNLALDNKLDASAYTPTDLSEYWTSAQTQTAIDGVKAYFIDLDAIMTRGGLTDADWDGAIAAVNAHRPVYIKFYNDHFILKSYSLTDNNNTMYLSASDGIAASRFTIIKNGSNDYSLDRAIRGFVTSAEKDAWNAKADASAITSIESDITAVSNDLNTLSGAVIDNEYTVSQAINSLNNRVAAVESGGTGGGISSGEVQTMIDDSLDIYWTSAQTQTAIDAAKAYYIDFATIMTQGIHDADWDGIVAAIDDHRPIYAGYPRNDGGILYYGVECMDKNSGNTEIVMTASNNSSHYFYTFTKNGSNDYAFTYDTRYYVTNSEKNTWNTKQDELVSGTNIKTINNESILGSGNIDIQTGGSVTVDSALNSGSTNPVQNKAIAANIIDHYESAKDIMGKPRYLKAVTKSGGISIPLSLYFSTINNKDIFANNGNNIIPTVNTFSLVETSAITTSMTSSSTDAQVPSAKAVYDQFGGLKLVKLTQAEYDALSTKDNQTLYIVVD